MPPKDRSIPWGDLMAGLVLAWVIAFGISNLVWAIAAADSGVTGALVSDGAPQTGLHPTGFDPTIAGGR